MKHILASLIKIGPYGVAEPKAVCGASGCPDASEIVEFFIHPFIPERTLDMEKTFCEYCWKVYDSPN